MLLHRARELPFELAMVHATTPPPFVLVRRLALVVLLGFLFLGAFLLGFLFLGDLHAVFVHLGNARLQQPLLLQNHVARSEHRLCRHVQGALLAVVAVALGLADHVQGQRRQHERVQRGGHDGGVRFQDTLRERRVQPGDAEKDLAKARLVALGHELIEALAADKHMHVIANEALDGQLSEYHGVDAPIVQLVGVDRGELQALGVAVARGEVVVHEGLDHLI
mmetsp:Transcript_25228/g.79156  ORF Transcript_25228/g.79156 Transcript_25228/m.79156 type:complete len:222 (+) Transcript_25228:1414-2079(+)